MAIQSQEQLSTRGGEKLEIGTNDGQKVNEVIASTRFAMHQLYIFVGGTGLETLISVVRMLRPHDIKFGDESLAATRPVIPYALFVDTDVRAAQSVQDDDRGLEDDDSKRYRLLIEEVKGSGVEVCTLFHRGADGFLDRTGLRDKLTANLPSPSDPRGSKADPRVGEIKYLAVRNLEDGINPREIARRIISSWGEAGKAQPSQQTLIVSVGGLHGGTGQISLPLMADVVGDASKKLRGFKTTIETERYMMTSESAGIDKARSRDGLQRKRMLNTASGVILANAADVKHGVQMTDSEFVEGRPSDFTFVVGGTNAAAIHVPVEDGHYVPTRVIAKEFVNRILGLDLISTGRSNAKLDRTEDEKGPDVENKPMSVFSSLGASELLPLPSRAQLTAEKRRIMFKTAVGLGSFDAKTVGDKLKEVFVENYLRLTLDDAQPPRLEVSELGADAAERKKNAEEKKDEFLGLIEGNLSSEIKRSMRSQAQEATDRIDVASKSLLSTQGLNATIAFFDAMLRCLNELSQSAQQLKNNCSNDILDMKIKGINMFVSKIKNKKIPRWNIPLCESREDAEQKIDELCIKLSEACTQFASLKRDSFYLMNFDRAFINVLRVEIERLKNARESEKRVAEKLLREIQPDTKEQSLETAFDVRVPMQMTIHDDPDLLRSEKLPIDQPWTEEKMKELIDSVFVTPAELDLTSHLTKNVLTTLGNYSSPLSRSAIQGGEQAHTMNNSSTAVPAADKNSADMIPVPDGSTRIPVGIDGPYIDVQEYHGINALLDDQYVRECVEALLATPPTLKQAKLLMDRDPADNGLKLKLNREGQFTFKGQAGKLLPSVFQALAQRQVTEKGGKGKILQCDGEDCGVAFYVSPTETKAGVTCCPGCRNLPKKPTIARVAVAPADVVASTAGKTAEVLKPKKPRTSSKKK